MCGRYSFAVTPVMLESELGTLDIPDKLNPQYNIAPTQQAYLVTNEEPEKLQLFSWGLIPYWSKEGRYTNTPLINARCETLEEKPSFRLPFSQHRCLIPADSFYEWEKSGKERKPFRILRKDGRILCMAGLWDVWKHGDITIHSFTIVTTRANEDIASLHDRMPVLLTDRTMQTTWLEETNLSALKPLFEPAISGLLTLYPVSNRVNYIKNNDPGLHTLMEQHGKLFDY